MKKLAILLLLVPAACHRSHGNEQAADQYKSSFSMNESTRDDMGRQPSNPYAANSAGQMSQATPGQMGR